MKHSKLLVIAALMAIVTALCQTLLVFPAMATTGAANATVAKVRVGTYNIQNGSGVNDDFTIIAQDIKDAGLDIVGVQEVDKFTTRCPKNTMAELAEATGYNYKYSKAISLQGGEYGIGLLSKYPIISYETIYLPSTEEQRVAGHAVIDIDGVQVDFLNTHLAWPSRSDRANQLVKLKDMYKDYTCAILVGDLNSADPAEYSVSFPISNFANGLENKYITNAEDGPIDNIISTASTVKQTATGMIQANGHTDHNMLWADLEIKENADLREEDGGVRFYVDGEYLTGLQKIGFDTVYFDPTTGLMAETAEGYDFEEVTACGITVYRQPYVFVREGMGIYMYDGTDVTEKLTDGNYTDYLSEYHWYDSTDSYLWTVENNKLIIGGKGTVEKNDAYMKLSDEIKEVIILPNTVSSVAQNAFAGLTNVEKIVVGKGVTSVGKGAFNTGSQKLEICLPSGLTLNENVTAGTPNVTKIVANDVAALTVAPIGDGIVNEDGKTLLKLKINSLTLAADDQVVLIYTDGERIRENGGWFSSAIKYTEVSPVSSENGEFVFDVCNAEGENQFIPAEDSSYVVTVQVWNGNKLKSEGKSAVGAVKCRSAAIYDKMNAIPTFASAINYVQIDLGKAKEVAELGVYLINAGSRYTKWMAYGSNDPTLPLSRWTYLTGKTDTVSNTADTESKRTYALEQDANGNYPSVRYIRLVGTYDSARWSILLTEVNVIEPPHEHAFGEWTKVDDQTHEHVCECGEKEVADHTWDNGVVVKEPTAEEYGEMKYTCTGCGATKTARIDKTEPPVSTGDNTVFVMILAVSMLLTFAVVFKKIKPENY